jgi:hypothetical protein
MDFFTPIQGDAHIGQTDILQFSGFVPGNQGSIGGDNRPHAMANGIMGQFQEIGSDQGFASGKKKNRRPELGQIIDHGLGLGSGHLVVARGLI